MAKIQHGSGDGSLDPGADTFNYSDFGMWERNQCPDHRGRRRDSFQPRDRTNRATTVGEGILVYHPTKGRLPVEDRGGCPHIPKALALELIEELEEREAIAMRRMRRKES